MTALERRLTDLELLVTHLQRDTQHLNEVVIEQGKVIESLGRQFELQRGLVQRLEDRLGETTDPLDEKPPHY